MPERDASSGKCISNGQALGSGGPSVHRRCWHLIVVSLVSHSVASQKYKQILPVCKVESPQAPHSFGRGGDVDRLGCSNARHTGSWCMLGEQSPQLLFGLPLAGRGHCSEQGFLLMPPLPVGTKAGLPEDGTAFQETI